MTLPVNLRAIVQEIVKILKNEESLYEDEDKIDALDELWNLSDLDYKAELADPSLGVLAILIRIVTSMQEDREMLYYALGCLWFLSRNIKAKILMSAPDFQLPATLMEILKLPNLFEDSLQIVENILTNCSMAEENHSVMFDPELGFLEYIKCQLYNSEVAEERPFQTCNFMIFKAKDSSLIYFISSRIHEVVLNRLLSVGSNLDRWGHEDFVTYWALIFIMSFSTLPNGRKALQHNSTLESFLRDIILNERHLFSAEGLKAGIIYVNVFSHSMTTIFMNHVDQKNGKISLDTETTPPLSLLSNFLSFHPKFLNGILLLIDLTINFTPPNQQEFSSLFPGFLSIPLYHSIFTLRDLFSCLKHLSLFGNNRWKIIQMMHRRYQTSFTPFHQILDAFLQDQEEFLAPGDVAPSRGGGGGKDYITLSSMLECFLNLSYAWPVIDSPEEESRMMEIEMQKLESLHLDDGKEVLVVEANGFIPLKKEFRLFLQRSLEIARIPKSRGIPEEIYLLVRVILKRLQEDW